MNLRVLVIGRGRLGSSLARALEERGCEVARWPGRGRWPAHAPALDVVLLAVADPFLASVAERLATRAEIRCPVLHASGARDVSVLAALRPRALGVMHPLVSFASRRAPPLAGATLVIDGDPAAQRVSRRIARVVGLDVIAGSLHGPRYHAAAALVANGSAALATRAIDALEAQGIARPRAQRAIAGLLRSVADNVARVGAPAALTGPIVRGDAATVAAHRSAIDPRTRAAYDAIAPVILDVARDAGLTPTKARAIRAALTRASSTRRTRAR